MQLLLLLLMGEIGTSLFTIPSRLIAAAGPDAWISLLVPTTAYGLLVAWVVLSLSRRFPEQVFTEYLPEVLGFIPGKILAGIFALALIHLSAAVLSGGANFIHITNLRETPPLMIETAFAVAAFYGAYLGIEVIARHNQLLFIFFSLATLAVVLMVIPDLNLDNFRPLLENGIRPVLIGTWDTSAWRGEVFLLLMFYPYLNLKQEASQAAYGMVVLSAIYLTIVTISVIGVFGAQIAGTQLYAVFNLARYISLGEFIERIDILMLIFWIAGVIIKLSIYFYAAAIALATTLGIKNYRWPLLGLMIASTFIANSFLSTQAQLNNFYNQLWPAYGLTIELLVPGLILLLAVLFKKGAAEGK